LQATRRSLKIAVDDAKERTVKFLVLWRMELSLLSREMAQAVGRMGDYGATLEREKKVLLRYHVVGAHGGAWIYEVDSNEEFERLLARAPVFNFARYEVHALAEMDATQRTEPGV
jgi:muconolactone delta-isomerase